MADEKEAPMDEVQEGKMMALECALCRKPKGEARMVAGETGVVLVGWQG